MSEPPVPESFLNYIVKVTHLSGIENMVLTISKMLNDLLPQYGTAMLEFECSRMNVNSHAS